MTWEYLDRDLSGVMGLNFYTIFGATDQRIAIWWNSLTLTLCHNWEKIETRSNNCSIGLHYICITMAAMMCSVFNHQVYPIKGKKEFLPGDAYAKDLAWWFIFLPVTLITRQFRDRILWCPEQIEANWCIIFRGIHWNHQCWVEFEIVHFCTSALLSLSKMFHPNALFLHLWKLWVGTTLNIVF